MMSDEALPPSPARRDTGTEHSLPGQVAEAIRQRREVITADVVAIFPSSGPQRLDTDYCLRLGGALVLALADAVEGGAIDYRSSAIAHLTAVAAERAVAPDQLFTFAYIAERTAGDELSLHPDFGATTEPWSLVGPLVREAVMRVLAAWTTRLVQAPSAGALTDALTTLHTRAVFEAALRKECHRAERFLHPFAVFIVDVDGLGELNRMHGYGVGDRVLERLGILLRTFFREHDWVARYDEDAFVVLLPETTAADAATLGERARSTVEDRLAFRDYRTEQRVVVTVSVAVVAVQGMEGLATDPARVLLVAEEASRQARAEGRGIIAHLTVP